MNLCDICKKNSSRVRFDSSRPGILFQATLPRVRSESLYFCYECSPLLGIDRDKYKKCDRDTRVTLGKYDPVPRRNRLIYKELSQLRSSHKNLDKIIAEYAT